jgi:hypothetical protein
MQVRFDRGMIEELVAAAPAEFTLIARNPARNVEIGGRNAANSSVGGPAYSSDLDRGRRTGTYADQCDYLKLVQSLNVLHQEGGGPFEAQDLPAGTRHLDLYYAQITLLDKNWQPQGLGRDRANDALEMAAISLGKTREELVDLAVFTCVINTNSPLQLDVPMAEGLMVMAEHGQPTVITPFTLAGAMAPITLAGALAQQHAEALAGISLAQIARPGVPVIYGGFTSNVDMKSGSPVFGTPEYTKAAQASGQLARRIGVPFRSSNVTAANAVDAQATYESAMSLWGAMMGGAHLINHAAPRGGLARGRSHGLVREADHRRGDAADDGGLLRAHRGFGSVAGAFRDPRCRTRRALLRHGAHSRAIRDRLLRAARLQLGQPRDLARGRRHYGDAARKYSLEAAARRVSAAAAGSGNRRGAGGLRDTAQGAAEGEPDHPLRRMRRLGACLSGAGDDARCTELARFESSRGLPFHAIYPP